MYESLVLSVTTLSDSMRQEYGEQTIPLMENNLPGDLLVCGDRFVSLKVGEGKAFLNSYFFEKAGEFANKYKKTLQEQSFRKKAAKFSWKVYAMAEGFHKAYTKGYDHLIWIDADVYVNSEISEVEIEEQIDGYDIAWLDRPHFSHGETGFIIFDVGSMWTYHIIMTMMSLYDNETLFMFNEWHDAYPFSFFVNTYKEMGMRVNNMNRAESGTEAVKYSPFGDKMRHVK